MRCPMAAFRFTIRTTLSGGGVAVCAGGATSGSEHAATDSAATTVTRTRFLDAIPRPFPDSRDDDSIMADR